LKTALVAAETWNLRGCTLKVKEFYVKMNSTELSQEGPMVCSGITGTESSEFPLPEKSVCKITICRHLKTLSEFPLSYVSHILPANDHHSKLGCLDLDFGNADWVESHQFPSQLTLWQQNTGQMQVPNDPCWTLLNLQAVGCCGPYRTDLQLHLPLADHQPARAIIISQMAESPSYEVQLK
jgi:hypothetical protein